MRYFSRESRILLALILGLFCLFGCRVQFVADYDAQTYEEILRAGKEVDRFYGSLLEDPADGRQYETYTELYVAIESELRSLVTRNKSRPLNEESTRISESILKLWVKYKDKHKSKNTYSDGNAKLDRDRFVRLFISAASAEAAKNLDPADADASKDSKGATR